MTVVPRPHLSNRMRHASTGTRMHPWELASRNTVPTCSPIAGRRGSIRIHAQTACIKHAAVRPGTVIRIFLDDGKLAARRFMGGFARANGKVHSRLAINQQHAALILQMNDDFAVPRPRLADTLVMIPDIAREAVLGIRNKSFIGRSISAVLHQRLSMRRPGRGGTGSQQQGNTQEKKKRESGVRHAACFTLFPRGNQARFPSVPACLE